MSLSDSVATNYSTVDHTRKSVRKKTSTQKSCWVNIALNICLNFIFKLTEIVVVSVPL